jgi:hypothetical protein
MSNLGRSGDTFAIRMCPQIANRVVFRLKFKIRYSKFDIFFVLNIRRNKSLRKNYILMSMLRGASGFMRGVVAGFGLTCIGSTRGAGGACGPLCDIMRSVVNWVIGGIDFIVVLIICEFAI